MNKYILIVNPSGRLSACPMPKDFNRGGFETDGMMVFNVSMDADTRTKLWNNRDNAFIHGDGLPPAACEPGNVYFQVRDGQLVGSLQPSETLTADACMSPLCKTVTGDEAQPV